MEPADTYDPSQTLIPRCFPFVFDLRFLVDPAVFLLAFRTISEYKRLFDMDCHQKKNTNNLT